MGGTKAQEKRWEYQRAIGRPALLRHDTPEVQWALAKIRSYHQRGMSLSAMADQVGLAQDAITRLGGRKDRPGMRRTTFEKIRRIEFDTQEGQRAYMPLLGAQRRLRALRADGFPYGFLSESAGHAPRDPRLLRIITGRRTERDQVGFIIASTARNVERVYDKLAGVDPRDLGVSDFAHKYSVNRAAKLGYAPSRCWDPDTIDDPDAIPQWTGRCGTPLGNHIHVRDDIPLCKPCRKAGPMAGYPGFVPAKLAALRARRGLSLREVQDASGVHTRTINGWERGHYSPRQPRLDQVLSVLDATVEDVIEGGEGP